MRRLGYLMMPPHLYLGAKLCLGGATCPLAEVLCSAPSWPWGCWGA